MDRGARRDGATVTGGAAAREQGGGRGADAGAAAERALPARLRHGGVSDLADLPRGARHRERARRPQARPPHGRERRRRFRDLQGHHLVRGLGRGGATRRDFEKMTITAAMKRLLERVSVAWNSCDIRSSPRKRGPRSPIASTRLWIPAFAGMNGRGVAAAAAALLLAACGLAGGEEAKPESSRVRLAAGGKAAQVSVPLKVTGALQYVPERPAP